MVVKELLDLTLMSSHFWPLLLPPSFLHIGGFYFYFSSQQNLTISIYQRLTFKIDESLEPKEESQKSRKVALGVAETNNAYKMLVVEHGTISKMGKTQFSGAGTEFENPLYFYLHLGRASRRRVGSER